MKKLILITIIFWFGSAHANTVGYNFHMTGFSEGATVSGWFTGKDLNHDGYIRLWDNEVEDFKLVFTGNSIVPSFTHRLPELLSLFFDFSSHDRITTFDELGGLESRNTDTAFVPGRGSMTIGTWYVEEMCPEGVSCYRTDYSDGFRFTVTDRSPVPLPTPVWLLFSGLIGLVGLRHRKE